MARWLLGRGASGGQSHTGATQGGLFCCPGCAVCWLQPEIEEILCKEALWGLGKSSMNCTGPGEALLLHLHSAGPWWSHWVHNYGSLGHAEGKHSAEIFFFTFFFFLLLFCLAQLSLEPPQHGLCCLVSLSGDVLEGELIIDLIADRRQD